MKFSSKINLAVQCKLLSLKNKPQIRFWSKSENFTHWNPTKILLAVEAEEKLMLNL